jgi:serine/threonine protein kinase
MPFFLLSSPPLPPSFLTTIELAKCNLNTFILANQRLIEKENGILAILGIAIDIALGLYAIHLHNLAHCDLKPENCLVLLSLTNKVVIKVADFGSLVEVPKDGSLLPKALSSTEGTPAYAPDTAYAEEKRKYGFKTDVHSLAFTVIDLIQCGFGFPGSIDDGNTINQGRRCPEFCPPGVNATRLWTILEKAFVPYEQRISLSDFICELVKLRCELGQTHADCRDKTTDLWKESKEAIKLARKEKKSEPRK